MLALILNVIGILVPTILQNTGVIGASTSNLITGLLGPVETLIANLKAGQSKTTDALAVLAAASGVIAVLKATTNMPAEVLTQIAGVDKDVQAALSAYAAGGTGLDLTKYTQAPEVQ
jgi:hypothetical protein